MANVDWQGFLRGIRESIETIRTPIDPIAIQGTAHQVGGKYTIPAGRGQLGASTLTISLTPPSDGYNRVTFWGYFGRVAVGSCSLLYQQPQKEAITSSHVLSNSLSGAGYEPKDGVAYTIEIPDRNCGLEWYMMNSDEEANEFELSCIFWRQY